MAVRVVGAAIFRAEGVLAARRGPGRAHAGKWEFPGGKVEPGESDEAACRRELQEELAIEAEVHERLAESVGAVHLVVYRCTATGAFAGPAHDALRWLPADALGSVEWASADVPILPAVRRALST